MKKKILKYGIGIDMGSKKFHVCITSEWDDGHQRIESTKTFDNTSNDHKNFYQWVEKHRKNKEVSYQILMEVTGFIMRSYCTICMWHVNENSANGNLVQNIFES